MKPSLSLGIVAGDAFKAVNGGNVIVVIDALRCCSTIVTALANGAAAIIPVETISQAQKLKKKYLGFIIAGERKGLRPNGFVLGNSPLEFTPRAINRRGIILTTTNGTKTISLSRDGRWVLIGAFLNARAVAMASLRIAEKERTGISLLLAGKEGQFSLEDFLCAGAVIESYPREGVVFSDAATAALLSFKEARSSLEKIIQQGSHAQYLGKQGFENDIRFCCQMNIFSIVPFLQEGKIVPLETLI